MFGIARLNTIAKAASTAGRPLTVNTFGNAQVDTAQSKYGGASALFDGTGDYLTVNSTTLTSAVNGTIEFWFRFNVNTSSWIFSQGNGSTQDAGSIDIRWSSVDGLVTARCIGNATDCTYNLGTAIAGTWYHLAFVKDTGNLKLYIDGQLRSTQAYTGSFGSTQNMYIGTRHSATGTFNGWLDDIRISSTAIYTNNFTIPAEALKNNDASTLLLIHGDGTDGSTTFTDDNITPAINYSAGTGGTVTTWTEGAINWKAHAFFAGTNTFTVTNVGETGYKMFGFLVAGGGGGGGKTTSTNGVGGGGGGGEVNSMGQLSIAAQSYTIVVGAGGTAGSVTTATRGGDGGNSSAFGTTVLGGAGGANNTTGGPATAFTTYTGGGGGTASSTSNAGGSGSTRNGGSAAGSATTSQRAGGGGGGYNANGSNGALSVGGAGGAGYTSTIANSVYGTAFGAGGGGGGATAGAGGNSGVGGGAGAVNGAGNAGIGYGCGGGGARTTSTTTALGGAGKEGIFIVYYQVA